MTKIVLMLIQEFMMYIVDKWYKRHQGDGMVDLIKVVWHYPYNYEFTRITDEEVSTMWNDFLKTKWYVSPLPFKIVKHDNPD